MKFRHNIGKNRVNSKFESWTWGWFMLLDGLIHILSFGYLYSMFESAWAVHLLAKRIEKRKEQQQNENITGR